MYKGKLFLKTTAYVLALMLFFTAIPMSALAEEQTETFETVDSI